MKNIYYVCGDEVIIKLTQGKWTIINLEDLPLASRISSWCAKYDISSGHFYVTSDDYNKPAKNKKFTRVYLHRLVLGLPTQVKNSVLWPDHKDRNPLDNRRSNLRIVSHSTNILNQGLRTNNSSGVKGVCYVKASERWHAYIYLENRKIDLGYYIKKSDAIEARSKAEDAYII